VTQRTRRKFKAGYERIKYSHGIRGHGLRVLVVGNRGLLGSDLIKFLNNKSDFEVIGIGQDDLDITNNQEVIKTILHVKPEYVINCAAYTDVDRAERDRSRCAEVNIVGALNLGNACVLSNTPLIHISTASVFSSTEPNLINSNAEFNPANFYSVTKAEAEVELLKIFQDSNLLSVFRPYWIYGHNKPNFVSFVVKELSNNREIKVVQDQAGQPTSTTQVCEIINWKLRDLIPNGIYPATTTGIATRFEWALEISTILGLNSDLIKPIRSVEFQAAAVRPFNASLDHSIWAPLGVSPQDWKSNLREYLTEVDF